MAWDDSGGSFEKLLHNREMLFQFFGSAFDRSLLSPNYVNMNVSLNVF